MSPREEVSWVFDAMMDMIGALVSLLSGGFVTLG